VSSSEERKKRSFVERHGLWNDEQFEAAANADKCIEERGLEVVRLSFPDQHGVLRGKTLAALRTDACLAAGFGKDFVDYYLRIKEAEVAHYPAEVTEWEQREYFELF
jgi:glutamine synthetase